MNGAQVLMRTAAAAGITVCFANPGTTELPLVAALDKVAGIRPVLGLFEGCCTGAADGFGRMAGRPALTLLHLGPGFANGIANLHNARRACTPIVNLIGEHATWHLAADAPLTMDIEALAATVGWWRRCNRPDQLSADMADAITEASKGQVASLILPHDVQLAPSPDGPLAMPVAAAAAIDAQAIDDAAACLRDSGRTLLLLGGKALSRPGLMAAAAIAKATGCDLMVETFPARMERGEDLPCPARLPYFPEAALKHLAPYRTLVLAGAKDPVAFFGYPGGQSRFLNENQKLVDLAPDLSQAETALAALAEALGAKAEPAVASPHRPDLPSGKLTAPAACAVLAALQPENAIVIDEAVSSGGAYFDLAAVAPPHTLLTLTGGSLGFGLPCGVGAALACPSRPVITLQADGAAMYTIQTLWMQASLGLNTTTLVCVNNRYEIIRMEMARAGGNLENPATSRLTVLDRPGIDWVKLSRGMGVPAVAVATADDLAEHLRHALTEPGPHLIAMDLEPK